MSAEMLPAALLKRKAVVYVLLVCDLSGQIHTGTVRFEKAAGDAGG
jgi:hypothetical protein